MKALLVLVLAIGVVTLTATAASSPVAIAIESAAGVLGGGIGFFGGFLIGHELHLWKAGSVGPLEYPAVQICVSITAAAGASIGTIIAGTLMDTDGNVLRCAGGALAGAVGCMILRPLVDFLFPENNGEWLGYASALCAAAGAVVGFNIGATER